MNYYIERHDKDIILDALETLHQEMFAYKQSEEDISAIYSYSMEDVDRVFKYFLDTGEESWDLK